MASVFDLHVHTTKGSSDSSLSPEEMVREAKRIGLTGVCLTEHSGWLDRHAFDLFARQQDIVLIRALEVETEYGHVLVFGLDGYLPGATRLQDLQRLVRKVGGFMVAAHPFRYLLNTPPYNRNLLYKDPRLYPKTPQEASRHMVFEVVDAIEVVNGANSEEENRFALEVARLLGKPGTGGSDAHSVHGLGKGVTIFDGPIRNEKDFLEALRAGAFRPGEGFPVGTPRPFAV
jgi:predicted metal-dependent phosphoesterase TrpH